MALRKITSQDVDELRMPPSTGFGADPRGMVDPLALQAAAWQTPYDVDARRAAIAKALLDQQMAQQVAAAAPTSTARDAAGMGTSPLFDYKDSAGVGPGGSPAVTGETPGNVVQDRFFENAQPIRSFDEDKPPPNSVPVVPQPEDVPPSPPDVPVEPDQTPTPTPEPGQGRVTVTPTPQSMREDAPQPTTPNPNELPSVSTFATPNVFNAPPAGTLPVAPSVPGYPGLPDFGRPADMPPSNTPVITTDVPLGRPGEGIPMGAPTPGNPLGTPIGTPTPAADDDNSSGREGTAGGPGAPGQGKGSTVADDQQALSDLGESMQAINEMGRAMVGAPPSAPTDQDVPAGGPLDVGGRGYSPAAAMTAGAQTGRDYGGFGYGAGKGGMASMVGAMTSPGIPSPDGGKFAQGWGEIDLGDLGAPGAAATAGLTDTGPLGGDFSPSAADMALSAPGGFDMSGSATGGNAGPGMGMSEGAAAAAAAAASAAAGGAPAGFGSTGFGPGMGMSEGAAQAAADAAQAAADQAAAASEGDPGAEPGGNTGDTGEV